MASYVGLLRLEVRVTDASDRVEAASRSRAELVANVIHASTAFDCFAAERLAKLRGAAERAGQTHLAPRILEEPALYREFLLAQDELTQAVGEFWTSLQSQGDEGALVLVEDLRGSVEEVENLLLEQLAELDRSIDTYHARSGRFPRSVIAAMVAGKESAVARPRVAATPETAPAPGTGPG